MAIKPGAIVYHRFEQSCGTTKIWKDEIYDQLLIWLPMMMMQLKMLNRKLVKVV